MEAVEARKNIKPANDLIKALGIKDLQQHFLKHRAFFTEQEIKEYFQNFQKFDADNDGMISAADITRISAKMGEKVDKQKLTQLMHPKKPNENISFDDFLDIMRDVHHGTLPADKGFAHLYFRGKDLIKFPSEFRLKEISPTFHSTTSDEMCILLCFVNMILQGEDLESLPMNCDQVRDLQKLCDGKIFCRLLNHLKEGLVPLDKFCDKPDMSTSEMTANQILCLAGAANYGCDVKDIDAFDLAHGVEYRLLALLSQIHQVAKAKIYKLDKHIEDYAKQMKEKREKAPTQPQQPKGGKFEKPKKARGERRRTWRQKSAAKKKEAKEISLFTEGTDPEEFLVGWCNFHLKKFQIEVGNLAMDFVDGMNWLYLMNALDNKIVTNDLLNQAKQLSFDEADKRGEMVLEFAKQMGVKIDITPVDIVKGDALINFAFVNQLYNLFAAGKQSVQDIIKMQNECLGYLIKGINDLEDLEMLMDDEITSLKDNVENLEDSLAGIVGELLVDEIAAMTGIPIPSMTMQALTPANSEEMFAEEEEEPIFMQRRIPSAPPLLGWMQQGPSAGVSVVELSMDEPEEEEALEEALEEAVRDTQSMEGSLQAQMMDLMQQVKTLMDAQREAAIPKPVIPATIKREVDQAATRTSELQLPEKEGLAYRKGVLKWKPCKVIVKNNRLFVFKAGRTTPSEDIYLSEAIKISQEPTTHGYFALRLTLSLTDSVILGWSSEFVFREWFTFLSTKIRPTITRTDFMMSGQRVVPHNAVQFQRVASSPAEQPIPTGAEFLEAVTEGDIPAVRQMLEKGADPLVTNSWGGNCLHIAAGYGNKDMMKFLTDNLESKHLLKFLLDQPTHFEKNTPLHLAVKTGDARLCQMLLDKGASKELKNQDNETASELATSRGSLEVMAIFSPPSVPPAPTMPAHNHPFLLRGAPMAAYRPQMGASQSPYILPSSSPYYRYRTQPF